jgi:holliday junction DNA helicase RuvA
MIEHLEGTLSQLTPAYAVIDCGGVGYAVNISLQTYDKVKDKKQIKLLTHLVVREDAHILFGFAEESERQLFRLLLSVQGIGPNTARTMLSSLSANELQNAILSGNLSLLKSVKGVGPKTAQRLLVELQDKMKAPGIEQNSAYRSSAPQLEEALSALSMLGFSRAESEKALLRIISSGGSQTVEDLVKQALKTL